MEQTTAGLPVVTAPETMQDPGRVGSLQLEIKPAGLNGSHVRGPCSRPWDPQNGDQGLGAFAGVIGDPAGQPTARPGADVVSRIAVLKAGVREAVCIKP